MTDSPRLLDSLDPRLREAARKRGIETTTEIQELAAPVLRGRSDALLLSPTGTGKTEAALLPLLDDRLREPSEPIAHLYITPLRALNRDLEQRLVALGGDVGLTVAVRHGDTTPAERNRQSRHPPDLLLTTPETLQILLVGRRLRETLRHLRCVVVDEIHELVPSDRGAQLALTLERLDAFVGHPVRRVGLSATVGNPEEVARFLSPAPRECVIRAVAAPRRLDLTARTPPPRDVALPETLRSELKADEPLLRALTAVEQEIRAHRTTLLFVNTRPTAEGLAARLQRLAPDLAIAVHHGSLSREIREEAERRFREGELRALVATSSLELGIDIGFVDHVIQFGSPHQVGRLVQRVGRSGHRRGRVVHGTVLALDDDDLEEAAILARRAIAAQIEPIAWRRRNRLAIAQQIVAALRADPVIDPDDLVQRFSRVPCAEGLSEEEWNDLLGYLAELGLVRPDGRTLRPGRATLQRFYATLSLIPDERTYRLRDMATRRWIGTLDERFVLTQILGQPEQIFLLHGRTWRVVEHRDDELLVETVAEMGQEPRWAGEDLPVPFDVAQEIGARRADGDYERYPIPPEGRERLTARRSAVGSPDELPTDRRITLSASGRLVVVGACFGTRTNETLALAVARTLTARLGAQVEVLAVEPTWIVLELPVALDGAGLVDGFRIPPEELEPLLERLLPTGLDYRFVFLTIARKLGLLPPSLDARELRHIEPLLDASRSTPAGEETLEKTLYDRHDLPHTRTVLTRIADGTIEVKPTAPSSLFEGVLSRLQWRVVQEVPPPTLLKAVKERLAAEPLALVCLRCGFTRTTTPGRYAAEGGSRCLICRGSLSAVLSPKRPDEIARLSRYAQAKWRASQHAVTPGTRRRRPRAPPVPETAVRAGYTSAELVAHHGERALYALAARGVGPETARRLLGRMYRNDDEFLTEILRAERHYARTRSFWD
jgi:ATP-dependent Lhr-like helicase